MAQALQPAPTPKAEVAQKSIQTVAPASQIVVRARAALAGGVGANIELRVDGQLVATSEVRASVWQDHVFSVPSMTGAGQVDITYVNDGTLAGVDRNLWVSGITVDGRTFAAASADVRYDVGIGSAAFDGANVLPGQEGMFWNGSLRFTLLAAAVTSSDGIYIDQAAGSDANPGTQASPWKTLARLPTVRLVSGQGVYLKCGQTWREPLNLTSVQLADGATVAGYGTTCASGKAVVSGADDFSGGWVKAGNVWSRNVPLATPQISRLFINGQSARTARWPNANAANQGWALIDAAAAATNTAVKTSATDLASLKGKDLLGAMLNVRSVAWVIEGRSVSAFDQTAGVIGLSSPTQYPLDANEGYTLEGKLWMLDAPGEFVHDSANGKLYVYPADSASQANLNAALVEASVRDTPIALAQRSGVRVANLAARMGRVDGISLIDMPAAMVENVESSGNGRAGIILVQDTTKASPTVRASLFDNNWMLGIDAKFAGAALISGNTVTATGTIAANGWSQGAIRAGAGAKVQDNNLDGSAYHGIHFSGTGGGIVSGNTVANYCLRLADCGGIYTWNGAKASGISQISTVEANQVLAASANTAGAAGFGIEVVAGIFLDDFASGVTVRNNLIYGMPLGIDVHNGSNNTIESNHIWLTSEAALVASMDQNDNDWMVGNVFRANQIVPVKTASAVFPAMPTFQESYPIWFFNNLSGSLSISGGSNVFTANQVVRLDGSLDGVHAWIRSNTQDLKMSSATWAGFNPADARTATPMTFAMYTLLLGPELITGGTFDTGQGSWSTWFGASATPGNAQASSGGAGCTGTCMKLLPGTTTDYIGSPVFSMKANAPHLFSYTARLEQAATLRFPSISRNATPYDSMATGAFSSSSKLSGVAGEVIRYEGFFTAKASDVARVNLQSKSIGVPIYWDNVSVRELQGFSFSTAADWSALAYAPKSGARVVSCATLGWGSTCTASTIDGTAVSLPLALAAGTQQLLLRTDSAWRR